MSEDLENQASKEVDTSEDVEKAAVTKESRQAETDMPEHLKGRKAAEAERKEVALTNDPREEGVSGTFGRPEISETDEYGNELLHVARVIDRHEDNAKPKEKQDSLDTGQIETLAKDNPVAAAGKAMLNATNDAGLRARIKRDISKVIEQASPPEELERQARSYQSKTKQDHADTHQALSPELIAKHSGNAWTRNDMDSPSESVETSLLAQKPKSRDARVVFMTHLSQNYYARVEGATWPSDGPAGDHTKIRFNYLGKDLSELPSRPSQQDLESLGESVYKPLESLPEHIKDLFSKNNVRTYVFSDIFSRFDIFKIPRSSITPEQRQNASFSDYRSGHYAINIYESTPRGKTSDALQKLTETEVGFNAIHEAGHMYQLLKGRLADSPLFRQLVESDIKNMKDHLGEEKATEILKANGYYFTDYKPDLGQPKRGYGELFAEEFAIASGASSDKPVTKEISKYFKASLAFVRSHYKDGTPPDPKEYPEYAREK